MRRGGLSMRDGVRPCKRAHRIPEVFLSSVQDGMRQVCGHALFVRLCEIVRAGYVVVQQVQDGLCDF